MFLMLFHTYLGPELKELGVLKISRHRLIRHSKLYCPVWKENPINSLRLKIKTMSEEHMR